jgi:hypothetical protein
MSMSGNREQPVTCGDWTNLRLQYGSSRELEPLDLFLRNAINFPSSDHKREVGIFIRVSFQSVTEIPTHLLLRCLSCGLLQTFLLPPSSARSHDGRQQAPLKYRQTSITLHGVTFRNTAIFLSHLHLAGFHCLSGWG